PIQIQPYGYYASFTPKPQENFQLWLGNLNKYHVKDGQLYNNSKIDRVLLDDGSFNTNATGIWGSEGVLGKLPLGTWVHENNTISSKRQVFTNRQIDENTIAQGTSSLIPVNLETLFDSNTSKAKFKNDPKKNYWLNILGYAVDVNTTGMTLNNLPTQEVRQFGAGMHSKPILLTQE